MKKRYPNLLKLLDFYKSHKKLFTFNITVVVLLSVVGLFTPIFSANTLSNLAELKFDLAIKYSILMVVFELLVEGFRFLLNTSSSKLHNLVLFDLKNVLINNISITTMSQVDKTNSGVFIERLHTDTNRCSDVLLNIISTMLRVIGNIAFLIYIAFINIWFFFIFLAFVFIIWIFDTYRDKMWFKDAKVFKNAREKATGSYNEHIRGIRDVKSLNIQDNAITNANNKNKYALDLMDNARVRRHKISSIRNVCILAFELLFLLIGILFIKNSWLLLSEFLIIYLYKGRIESLVSDVSFVKEYCIEGEISAQRIYEIIEDFDKEKFGDTTLSQVKGKIELKNVSFAYDKALVLKNISLEFIPNKTTAIVGKSGSGKTTILSLINMLYTTNTGSILLDGVDISTLSSTSLRENVGLITQQPYIFNTSIKENLLLIKPDATDEELISVLKKAQIYDFVATLENKMDSIIGENGTMLSGGQKQRIAIARLLLKNPKVIMLDEATSALDNESQNKIVDVIEDLKKDHTIIIVAHRLSTIKNADSIVVINEGKIVDMGSHTYLYKNCPTYKKLYQNEFIED